MAMREHSREPLEPYEPPQTDYEWDYDEEPARHETPKVLWGRIAILGVFLIAAFLIGRMTAGSGIPASDLERAERQAEDARAQVAALEQEVNQLEADLEDAESQQDTAPTDAGTDQEEEGTTPPEGEVETHVIQPGETLTTISEDYYGNSGYADYIADYNDLVDPSLISTGTEILIPPEPEG
jgi:nucleoid-associated protein YgaU